MKGSSKGLALVVCAVLALSFGACRRRAPPSSDWPPGMRATTAADAETLVHEAKGSVVLLVLYASWCSGCREELPGIGRLSEKYGDKGLKVIALALDDDPKDFNELLAERPLKIDLIRVAPIDNRALAATIHDLGGSFAQAIPYAAVFDRSGKLAREWASGSLLGDVEKSIKANL